MRIPSIAALACLLFTMPVIAQEDLAYQKPSASILALTDYEPAPSVSMDTKKTICSCLTGAYTKPWMT
ncbi:hypothetical protein [Niabella hibiscisoli]|uniref:hypothetical protein n=1 Tax=Niabella hibiscisoli TaxID=1825928 RepID=UPI001F0E2B42|nr:hypothetical protein [Niabella hibiscisoli]MCH5716613.1 hypothetical protein [Niabella hibiscisoli]